MFHRSGPVRPNVPSVRRRRAWLTASQLWDAARPGATGDRYRSDLG